MFDDFDTMDAFGAAEIFGKAPEYFHINYVSMTGKIVNSMQGVKVWTELLEPEKIRGILVIPGGRGARRLLYQEQEAILAVKKSVERAEVCMMMGEGSALVAQTGALFRRRIAKNQIGLNWKRMFLAGVYEVPDASWVADGKYYSSSNTISGLAMTLGVVADQVDVDVAENIASQIGYTWDAEDETIYQ